MFLFMSVWPYARTTHTVQVQESKKRFTYELGLLLVCLTVHYVYSIQAFGTSYHVATRSLIYLSQDAKCPMAINFFLAIYIRIIIQTLQSVGYARKYGVIRSFGSPFSESSWAHALFFRPHLAAREQAWAAYWIKERFRSRLVRCATNYRGPWTIEVNDGRGRQR